MGIEGCHDNPVMQRCTQPMWGLHPQDQLSACPLIPLPPHQAPFLSHTGASEGGPKPLANSRGNRFPHHRFPPAMPPWPDGRFTTAVGEVRLGDSSMAEKGFEPASSRNLSWTTNSKNASGFQNVTNVAVLPQYRFCCFGLSFQKQYFLAMWKLLLTIEGGKQNNNNAVILKPSGHAQCMK